MFVYPVSTFLCNSKLNLNIMEQITKDEMLAIKGGSGGYWIYDLVTGRWIYIEPTDLNPVMAKI